MILLRIVLVFAFLFMCPISLSCKEGDRTTSAKRYNLVICAIFQNESFFLKEWLEYHRLLGVEHFYLYNNLSDDQYLNILQPYIEDGVVDLFDWPVETFSQTDYLELLQLPAYNQALELAKESAEWAAFIDLDEFIVPVRHDSLFDMLKEYDSCVGLAINWQVFGTSNLEHLPEGSLIIENLVWKAPADHGLNSIVKFIVRPNYVKNIPNPHAFEFIEGYHAINSLGVPLKAQQMGQTVIHETVCINHYWFGTEELFFKHKVPRREKWGLKVSEEHLEEIIAMHNQVEDRTIVRFAPELRKRLATPKPFVIGHLMGQFGNQMFQIGTAMSLALDHGAVACFPDLVTERDFNIPLNYQKVFYNVNVEMPSEDVDFNYLEKQYTYSPIPYRPNMSIRGWFQSEKYFRHHRQEIMELFAPPPEIKEYLYEKYASVILNPRTVSIHFRSYDIEDPEQKVYLKCDKDYYLHAIESFPEDSLFVVFSNDMNWCKVNFADLDRDFIFIEDEAYYYDLYLMSMCKDNIIANSSFSWWGAYLNTNPSKRVIAPAKWFNPAYGADTRDLIPEEWILL